MHDEQIDTSAMGAEAASHAILRLVADRPGQMGRLRTARIIGGFTVRWRSDEEAAELQQYQVPLDWGLRDYIRLIDVLISGGLVTQSVGARPLLVLTRPGYRALEALEGAGTQFASAR